MAAEENMKKGMRWKQALRAVRLKRGTLEITKEVVRSVNWESFPETCWQDLCFGHRTLRKSPVFKTVAVLPLALGIGANTVIFSAVYAVLLNPLPFKDSDRLVFIEKKNPSRGWVRNPISPAEILAWRNQSGALEDIAAYTQRTCVLTGAVEAEEDPCEVIPATCSPCWLWLRVAVGRFLLKRISPKDRASRSSVTDCGSDGSPRPTLLSG